MVKGGETGITQTWGRQVSKDKPEESRQGEALRGCCISYAISGSDRTKRNQEPPFPGGGQTTDKVTWRGKAPFERSWKAGGGTFKGSRGNLNLERILKLEFKEWRRSQEGQSAVSHKRMEDLEI